MTAIDEHVAYAMGLHKLFDFKYDGQKYLYYYDKKTGLWSDDGIPMIKQKTDFTFNSHHTNEIISYLKNVNYVRNLVFNYKQNILPLKDGVIDLDTMEHREHNSSDMLTYSLPVYYNPEAESKHIIPFIEKTVRIPMDRWNLYAMIGYCFIRSTPYKAIFWVLGITNTGKSTFLEILSRFFGNLVSSVSVYDFDKPQYLEGLRGKMVNIEDELTGDKLSAPVINSLKWMSGSEITKQGKRMYINPKDISVKPKPIMGSNHYAPPNYPDPAYDKRCVTISFRHQFELSNKDNVITKMTSKNEMSALLNVALEHLKELNDKGSFMAEEERYSESSITLGEDQD